MFGKKKCLGCGKKTDKKFSFCPYCGNSFKARKESSDFGMLGRDDLIEKNISQINEIKMPFGLNKIMNSLIKQIESQMGELDGSERTGIPKGFKIQISSGMPRVQQVANNGNPERDSPKKSAIEKYPEIDEEKRNLPQILAESKVKRIDNKIVYEIDVPGVKKKEDVVVSRLETGIEIRAYSKDKCFVKTIPLKVELLAYRLEKEKIFIELKG